MQIDDSTLDLVRLTLTITLKIAAPILAAGLAVGLIISIVQAVTQIQEQTLTLVPKILVMVLMTLVLLGWIAQRLAEFAIEMLTLG